MFVYFLSVNTPHYVNFNWLKCSTTLFFFDGQEHGGNLSEAVNSHFAGDTNMSVPFNMQITPNY